MNVGQMSAEMLSFVLLLGVAGAAATMALLNVGVAHVVRSSELDEAPQVARWPQVLVLAFGSGLIAALGLGALAGPVLGGFGLAIGVFVAFTVRAARVRSWARQLTREQQALTVNLVIEMDSGEGSLYRAIETSLAEGHFPLLGRVLQKYVLARVAAGAFVEDALLELARSRLFSYAPIVADALRRLADLAGRDVSPAAFVDGLRVMDGVTTDIVRIEQERSAQTAQIRYSAYIVAGLVAFMTGMLLFGARSLGDVLLHTMPGNVVLGVVMVLVMVALVLAEYGAQSEPLRF